MKTVIHDKRKADHVWPEDIIIVETGERTDLELVRNRSKHQDLGESLKIKLETINLATLEISMLILDMNVDITVAEIRTL